jgi:hypothetical protein
LKHQNSHNGPTQIQLKSVDFGVRDKRFNLNSKTMCFHRVNEKKQPITSLLPCKIGVTIDTISIRTQNYQTPKTPVQIW